MALDTLLTSLRAFGGGQTFGAQQAQDDEVRKRAATSRLLSGIQDAAAQPGFDATTNPLVAQLSALDPAQGQQLLSNFSALDQKRQSAMFQDAYRVKQRLEAGDSAGALDIISRRVEAGKQLGGDMADTQEIGDMIAAGNNEGALRELDAFLDFGVSQGMLKDPSARTADLTTFNELNRIISDPNASADMKSAARIELGLDPRAGTISSVERISGDEEAQGRVISYTDRLERAKAQAREEGKAQGTAVTELQELEAMLPTLNESVNKLKTLADSATYTTGGRAFDTAARELGFGATEGGTARARFVSIVDNQTLPLLRQTFGSAFTEAEGNRLRDALVDPNATPEEKKAQLDEFIDMKTREIEAKQRRVGGPSQGVGRFQVEVVE